MKHVLLVWLVVILFGCSTQAVKTSAKQSTDELLEFAKANCFFWYFKNNNYDLQDIRAISGGIIEMGSYSADKYQQVSLLVKEYQPLITTKQNIDVDLLKCFQLERDAEFIRSLNEIK